MNALLLIISHPIKYPTIFMEASYYLSSEQPWHSGNPLILSNGDQSGLTYHADFLDGVCHFICKLLILIISGISKL